MGISAAKGQIVLDNDCCDPKVVCWYRSTGRSELTVEIPVVLCRLHGRHQYLHTLSVKELLEDALVLGSPSSNGESRS